MSKPEELWVQTFVVKIVSEKLVKPIELCGVEHLMFGGDDGKSAGGWYETSEEIVPFAVAKKLLEELGEYNCDLLMGGDEDEVEESADE